MRRLLGYALLVAIGTAVAPALTACGGSSDVVIADVLPASPPPAEAGASNPPQGSPSVTDAGAPSDTSGAPICPPLSGAPDDGSRFAVAARATKPKTLDGDFSDYDGCVSVVVDASTAARVKGTPAVSAKIMIEWEPSAIWIAASVVDPLLEGGDLVMPYMNDSLEIYVSSAGLRTGDYGPHDHQLVADHKGLTRAYPGARATAPEALVHVSPAPGGYRVEARIDAVFAFGARLSKGDVRFANFMINDGVAQEEFLIWAMQPHASCSCTKCTCNRSPALDTLLFAPLTLR